MVQFMTPHQRHIKPYTWNRSKLTSVEILGETRRTWHRLDSKEAAGDHHIHQYVEHLSHTGAYQSAARRLERSWVTLETHQ
jgi:hypothetical protein